MLKIEPSTADIIKPWLERDGVILLWRSINLSNPSGWWLTPLGASKPNWQAGNEPEHLLPADLEVVTYKEVKRIRIHTRVSSSGLSLKLTDFSANRLNAALNQIGDLYHENPVYIFDGDQAVIFVPDSTEAFTVWASKPYPYTLEDTHV